MRMNLQTHTRRCDGLLSAEETVRAAIGAGLSHIGITDHLDTIKLRPLSGVDADSMGDYCAELRDLARHYAADITVLAGVEVDFCRERTDFDLFSTPEAAERIFGGLDYVLFEYVNNPQYDGDSLDTLFEIRRGIPVPVGLAHPDIMLTFRGLIPRAAAGVLAQNDVFLELCPSGRNAVWAPGPEVDGEEVEEGISRLSAELVAATHRLARDQGNVGLRSTVTGLETELQRLHGLCQRRPAYRVPHHFIDEFFGAVRTYGVLLSIGADSHAGAEEVGQIDDALAFVEEHDLADNLITEHLWTR